MKKESVGCFSNKNLFVGIDVHKKRWVVTSSNYVGK